MKLHIVYLPPLKIPVIYIHIDIIISAANPGKLFPGKKDAQVFFFVSFFFRLNVFQGPPPFAFSR